MDRDRNALVQNAEAVAARFPMVVVEVLVADFTQPSELPLLDGLVAAVVEYDANRGNQ